MELYNESHTPQFIKTVDYQHDNVQNSIEMEHMIRTSGSNKEFKSPGRQGYQARYPAVFVGEREKVNGNKMGQQQQQQKQNETAKFSQEKYSMSPSNYSHMNSKNNNGKMPVSPPHMQQVKSSRNLTLQMGLNNNQYSHNNHNQQFNSPSHGNSHNLMASSPYVSSPSYQNMNYPSSSNNNNLNSVFHQNSPTSYQQQQFGLSSNSRTVIELQKICSQLKLSLQQSLSTQSSIQQQLNKQRTRSFQLSEIKRKLQEQLSKMQFELDRITSIDTLGQRQLMVKYQAQMLQNQRLNSQLNDTIQQLKRVKTQCRDMMSQNSKLRDQSQLLKANNAQLMTQMDELIQEVNAIKQQCNQSVFRERQLHIQNKHLLNEQQQLKVSNYHNNAMSHQKYQPHNNNIPSAAHLNSIHTTRTDNYQSSHLNNRQISNFNNNHLSNSQLSHNQPRLKSPQKHSLSNNNQHSQQHHQQQYINYDLQNSKLVQDYAKLQQENSAMKKLYKQFYQQSPKKLNQYQYDSSPHYQRSISQHSEQHESTNPNFYPNHNHYHSNEQQNNNPMLQTYQKHQLYSQINSLRDQVIQQLMHKYFTHSLKQAQSKKTNVLILFIKLLTKDIEIIQKMVINYLQARDILKKQLNLKKLTQGQQGTPTTESQIQAESIWSTVKNKLKTQLKSHKSPNNKISIDHSQITTLNINAYYLALFRLLTLVEKYQNKSIQRDSTTLAKIKHSALKYVHKIHQETQQITSKSQGKTDFERSKYVPKLALKI